VFLLCSAPWFLVPCNPSFFLDKCSPVDKDGLLTARINRKQIGSNTRREEVQEGIRKDEHNVRHELQMHIANSTKMTGALTVASMSNSGTVKCEQEDDGQDDHEKSGRRGPSATHGELSLLHGECFCMKLV
jgi:hypothetical protein